jgi:hypothetical protein
MEMARNGKHTAPAPAPAPSASTSRDDVPSYETIVGLRKTAFADAVREHAQLQRDAKAIQARIAELKVFCASALGKADVKSVLVDGMLATRIDGTSTHLDKAKATRLGGPKWLEVYNKALTSTPFTSFKTTEKKEEGEGEDAA